MLDTLRHIDVAILLWINHRHTEFLDVVFYWMSDRFIWIPFYAWLAWMLWKDQRKRVFLLVIIIAAMITISDQLASSLIKNTVMRLRPCHDPLLAPELHLVNGYCGGMYGFISSHASNTFALATFLGLLFLARHRYLPAMLWCWAGAVSFSRIYLAAHFPGDVLGGAILGILLGLLTYRIYEYCFTRINKQSSTTAYIHES